MNGTEWLMTCYKPFKEFNEQIINEEINKKAQRVEKEYYKDQPSDPERVGRLKNSITELTKLIELGGEIHPSALLEEVQKKTKLIINIYCLYSHKDY